MAKGGKFAALAHFRQEQHVDDEAPPSADSPAETEAAPQKPDEAEPPAEAVATVDAPEIQAAAPVPAEPSAEAQAAFPPIREEEPEDDVPARTNRQPREPVAKAPRPRGRPPGKRSDPDWKLFSHFLKRSTQRQATAILFEQDEGRDLSDVLQNLLEKWVARERAKI